MSTSPTYAFDEKGRVAAFHGDKVIASGTDFEKVAETAEEYFGALRGAKEHEVRKAATHITTPNGDKGTILGRTATLFSDSITVRFENGQIRHYDTFVGDGLRFSKEASDTPKSPVEYFQRKLDENAATGIQGLTARLNDLSEVRRGAAHLAGQGVSYADVQALHQIVLTADAETNEVKEALEYLVASDAEAMTPPKMAYTAVEQADLGGRADNWLEVVAQEMVDEAEAEDFDKLAAEGPVQFVSGLDTSALAHTGTVRDMAAEFIHTKTAGFQGDAVTEYRNQFVADVEMARRRESSYRQDVVQQEVTQRQASVADVSDEALFL